MEILTEDQKREVAVNLFREFLIEHMDVDALADGLDQLQQEYGRLVIEEDGERYVQRADQFTLLHQLKCICMLKNLKGHRPKIAYYTGDLSQIN
jgi:hypothetical protein